MKAFNGEKLLWEHIDVAADSTARSRGLMGRKELKQDEGLLIVPCNQVHTFQVGFDLDVVYLTAQKKVLCMRTLSPDSVGPCIAGAHCVLEVPAGSAAVKQINIGDRIAFLDMDD
jgi:Uncharacterized conserved protein